jgi:hypothetical protein
MHAQDRFSLQQEAWQSFFLLFENNSNNNNVLIWSDGCSSSSSCNDHSSSIKRLLLLNSNLNPFEFNDVQICLKQLPNFKVIPRNSTLE